MTKAIITKISTTIVKDSGYPVQIFLDLFLPMFPPANPNGKTICLNITMSVACDLADLLSKYDNKYILYFGSEQLHSYSIRWDSPKTVILCVCDHKTLRREEYRLGEGCVAKWASLINRVLLIHKFNGELTCNLCNKATNSLEKVAKEFKSYNTNVMWCKKCATKFFDKLPEVLDREESSDSFENIVKRKTDDNLRDAFG